jgi:hypothetical protein
VRIHVRALGAALACCLLGNGCIFYGSAPTGAPGKPFGITSFVYPADSVARGFCRTRDTLKGAICQPLPPPGGFSATQQKYLIEANRARIEAEARAEAEARRRQAEARERVASR